MQPAASLPGIFLCLNVPASFNHKGGPVLLIAEGKENLSG